MADHAHNHTPTFRRCLEHLKAEGFDEEGAHRICYSVHAGGEGASAKESAEAPQFIGVNLLENGAATAAGELLAGDLFESSLHESAVDLPTRTIKNVVLVGPESPTRKRSYPAATLREALPLYDGAKIYLNHPAPGTEYFERDVRDLAGQVKKGTARLEEGTGKIRADIVAAKTSAGDTLLGLAESMPNVVGSSHNAVGSEVPNPSKSGHTIIEKITSVRSVDIVTEPGTTKGLHESARTAPNTESLEMDPKLIAALTLAQLIMANPALVESIRKEAADDVRTKELAPLQEKHKLLEAQLATEAGTRIIEAVLGKKEHAKLPKVTADGLRKALAKSKDLTEAKVEAAIAEAKKYLKECGVDLDKAPTGKGKTKDVTESAAGVPANDGNDDESEDADTEDLRESMASLMGVSLDDEKDDEDDKK